MKISNFQADVIVIGTGPAGLAISAALGEAGLSVLVLSPTRADATWPATYGIWVDELSPLGLEGMLAHRWTDCSAYCSSGEISLQREYGLLDNARLQDHFLQQCSGSHVRWVLGSASRFSHQDTHSYIVTQDGVTLPARLVVDASGHRAALLARPPRANLAYQAAYGIVGRWSKSPIRPGQMVLMDYRTNHLPADERTSPATFLYAMDLGDGRFFVEETSLAHSPMVPFELLSERLSRRLDHMGSRIESVESIEKVLFPMDLPLPYPNQALIGFGAAACMVHPASGYSVGASLRWAQPLAKVIAKQLSTGNVTSAQVAMAANTCLWPRPRVRRRALYLYGLYRMMRMSPAVTQQFFEAFLHLPPRAWQGYLSDSLDTRDILLVMFRVFSMAPHPVRQALAGSLLRDGWDLWRALRGQE